MEVSACQTCGKWIGCHNCLIKVWEWFWIERKFTKMGLSSLRLRERNGYQSCRHRRVQPAANLAARVEIFALLRDRRRGDSEDSRWWSCWSHRMPEKRCVSLSVVSSTFLYHDTDSRLQLPALSPSFHYLQSWRLCQQKSMHTRKWIS